MQKSLENTLRMLYYEEWARHVEGRARLEPPEVFTITKFKITRFNHRIQQIMPKWRYTDIKRYSMNISNLIFNLIFYQCIGTPENHLTGRPCLIMPDFATAILSKEPPNAAKCSSLIVVMTEAARSELDIIFVASRAPPNPAFQTKRKGIIWMRTFHYKWP